MTDQLAKFINESNWIFAKTMPESPHYYIVRSKENEENFVALAQYIRDNGYQAHYGSLPQAFTYLEYEGYRYWTMGNSMSETTILNRCRIDLYEKVETPEGIWIQPLK